MFRKLFCACAVAACTASAPAPAAASSAPATPALAVVPVGVDASIMSSPTTGPVVASGRLTDAHGRRSAGTVVALAWPNEAYNRTLRVGDEVHSPTVGWSQAAADGSFSLRVDPSKIGPEYARPDGTVNLIALGWTRSSQGMFSFTANPRQAAAGAQTLPSTAAALTGMSLAANQALTLSPRPAASPTLSGNAFVCGWVLLSTYDTWSIIGKTEPAGSDVAWMVSQSSESVSVGAAYSYGGAIGSWSQSGSFSTTVGTSFTWAPSTYYRNYQRSLRYGHYRYCGAASNQYGEFVMYATGGYTTASIGYEYYSHCYALSPGQWERNLSNANHYSNSAGVLIHGAIGINLSMDTDYSTAHTIVYSVSRGGAQICGDNDVPSRSSNANTR